jgi:phytoene dehydrogenase-like protein
MSHTVVIVGAGMGGLAAAVRLARAGYRVRLLEARPTPGGLAAGFVQDGLSFDAGPYILLDRPGLEWAFGLLGVDLTGEAALRPLEDVYEVSTPDGVRVRFRADLEETAAGFERAWPGSGRRYVEYVRGVARIYQRLQPLQRRSRPGLLDLLRTGAWRHAPFLFRSLAGVLAATGLPPPVIDALSIWTHVAGQRPEEAPSPLAFVPALIHTAGAAYPAGGMGAIPRALAVAAQNAGVQMDFNTKVAAIRCAGGRVVGVRTEQGENLDADAVVSDAGLGTYLALLADTSAPARESLRRLPLQSPGVCAYLAVRGEARPPYLRFRLPGGGRLCRLLILPEVPAPEVCRDGWRPARLMAPMDHAQAQAAGPGGQRAYLDAVLAEDWWREHVGEHRVLATRIPAEWGAQYHLYADSMNPVMTARFMRAGRLAHRSPHVRGLYLAGSSTHPGQWVSFCAISGILAADRLREDLG